MTQNTKILIDRSLEIIQGEQASSGAFPACSSFSQYPYSWFRDGSFIAYSLLLNGRTESAFAFLGWCHRVILSQKKAIEKVVSLKKEGRAIEINDFLPTRYTLEGESLGDDWPTYQSDGYGAWLWCLSEAVTLTGDKRILHRYSESIRLTMNYILAVWDLPSYDCWEEYPDQIHTSTLASLAGGLKAINVHLSEKDIFDSYQEILNFVLNRCVSPEGYVMKTPQKDEVDASLLWLNLPFGLFSLGDDVMKKTLQKIEADLASSGSGGICRYVSDSYYGRGEWILLTAQLAWCLSEMGETAKAEQYLQWVEAQADDQGGLPEQVATFQTNPKMLDHWEKKWGKSASPLLWSHAMYLIAVNSLEERRA